MFSIFQSHPYVIHRGKVVELECKDLQNAANALQKHDKRSREECECDWEYATDWGIRRTHNPLCQVHRVTANATELAAVDG
jgi:hypothetical protein